MFKKKIFTIPSVWEMCGTKSPLQTANLQWPLNDRCQYRQSIAEFGAENANVTATF
jgi:hypothetical protein